MQKIEVTFIVLSYNKFEMLKECIERIITYTKHLSYEIIIIDNNSTEGDIFNYVSAKTPISIYKNDTNVGWPTAINQGIEYSKGKYICIVDNDVMFIENTARQLMDYYKSINQKAVIGPRLINKDGSIQVSITDFPSLTNLFFLSIGFNKLFPKIKYFNPEHMNYKTGEKPVKVEMLSGACLFFHKSVALELGGFDGNFTFYCSDSDFCLRLHKTGGETIYYPDSKVIHLGSIATSTTALKGYDTIVYDTIKYYRKHFGLLRRKLAYIFLLVATLVRSVFRLIAGTILLRRQYLKKVNLLSIKFLTIIKALVRG